MVLLGVGFASGGVLLAENHVQLGVHTASRRLGVAVLSNQRGPGEVRRNLSVSSCVMPS